MKQVDGAEFNNRYGTNYQRSRALDQRHANDAARTDLRRKRKSLTFTINNDRLLAGD
jgi:hypothetical protein